MVENEIGKNKQAANLPQSFWVGMPLPNSHRNTHHHLSHYQHGDLGFGLCK